VNSGLDACRPDFIANQVGGRLEEDPRPGGALIHLHAAANELSLQHVARGRAYEIHHNQHRPHQSLDAAAPLKPLPEPVDLDRYRLRRQTRTACLINEYRLVA
jgi:hypothetical protein